MAWNRIISGGTFGPPNVTEHTADGNRFLLNTVAGGSASTLRLNVVLNWDTGLKK